VQRARALGRVECGLAWGDGLKQETKAKQRE
jgi:hypothetical protein